MGNLNLVIFAAVVTMACSAAFALDIDLAKAGISVSDPANSNQVYAARELEKHLNLIVGCKDRKRTGGENAVFVIGSPAPGMRKAADFEALAAVKGGKVYFWGDDGRLDRSGHPCGGSLFAVYAFLDKVLGVKWVYPGDEGIVYKRRSRISVKDGWKDRFMPPLLLTRMRGGDFSGFSKGIEADGSYKWSKYIPLAMRTTVDEERRRIECNREWMLRMRHQTREQFSFGHAFGDWNKRFYHSHPEYLAMNEDGTRGTPEFGKRKSKFVKLCLSNPAVIEQILKDWVKDGKPKYFNICPTDAKGFCRCKACCALDYPLTSDEPFNLHKTDRYVDFWNRIAEKAIALRPDVMLCTYIYESYRFPPRKLKIKYPDNMIFGMVPSQEDDNAQFLRDWKSAGLKHFMLRPNYLCYRSVIPRGYERFYHSNFMLNLKNGMLACDYDGWPRSVMDFESYVIARTAADPKLPFEIMEREFLSQFGAAAPVMREYFTRVRERTEKGLYEVQKKPPLEREQVPDDSRLYNTVMAANCDKWFAEDLAIIDRAAKTPGLTEVELKRVELRRLICEHARRTHRFLLARDSMDRKSFAKEALDLLDYRIGIVKDLPDSWGRVFRSQPAEVKWWRSVPRKIMRKAYPEMELND